VHRIVARDRYVNGFEWRVSRCESAICTRIHQSRRSYQDADDPVFKGRQVDPGHLDDAIKFTAEKLSAFGNSVGVIASPRLTNESIFTLGDFCEGGYRDR
jgi:hypothetical protein